MSAIKKSSQAQEEVKAFAKVQLQQNVPNLTVKKAKETGNKAACHVVHCGMESKATRQV